MAEVVYVQREKAQLGLDCLLGELNLCIFLVCCNEDVDLLAEHEARIVDGRRSNGFQS